MESPASDDIDRKNVSAVAVQSSRRSRTFFMAQMALRTLALASSVVSTCVLVTSGMTVLVYGIRFQARYSYASAFRFLLVVDCALCGFSALSMLSLYFLNRVASSVKYHFLLFLHDMLVMVLAMAGCAASTAIGFEAKFGERKLGWMAVCNQVSRFCNRIVIAIGFSYVAFFCYLVLCFSSVKRLIRVSSSS